MKTIGLIGGISWVSTIDYYRIINTKVNERLGGNESARIILHSVNYGEIVALTIKGDWDSISNIITTAAQNAEKAGANCILLCANTMHKIADNIQNAVSIPLIHVADITADAIQKKNIKSVLLLGTRYTMEADFYKQRLKQYGIELILPGKDDIDFVNSSIYNEMGKGIFLPETKKTYLEIINKYSEAGAAGVILGCTEIPMLIKQEDCPLPVFDTTLLHASAAVDFALK
ncbi:MAG: aspartate/glutamate racemase family protein [Chitinophagaceae bacterium]